MSQAHAGVIPAEEFNRFHEGIQDAAKKAQALNPSVPKPPSYRNMKISNEALAAKKNRFAGKLKDRNDKLAWSYNRVKEINKAVEELKAQPVSKDAAIRLQKLLGGDAYSKAYDKTLHVDGELETLQENIARLERERNVLVVAVSRTNKEVKDNWFSDEQLAEAKRLESL